MNARTSYQVILILQVTILFDHNYKCAYFFSEPKKVFLMRNFIFTLKSSALFKVLYTQQYKYTIWTKNVR